VASLGPLTFVPQAPETYLAVLLKVTRPWWSMSRVPSGPHRRRDSKALPAGLLVLLSFTAQVMLTQDETLA